MSLTCFKAYDIRGRLGVDLDEGIARRIGRGFARALDARRVVLGRDCRASSEALAQAVAQALMDAGAEVLDLGLCGTEEMYFATAHFGADGGICVTASAIRSGHQHHQHGRGHGAAGSRGEWLRCAGGVGCGRGSAVSAGGWVGIRAGCRIELIGQRALASAVLNLQLSPAPPPAFFALAAFFLAFDVTERYSVGVRFEARARVAVTTC